MKTILTLLIACTFVFASCDKEERMETKLEGTWELRHLKGGQIAGRSPDYPPGNGNLVKIDAGTIQFSNSNGVLGDKFKFAVKNDEQEIDGVKFKYTIVREGDRPQVRYYFKLNGNKLLLATGSIVSDGGTATYVRQ